MGVSVVKWDAEFAAMRLRNRRRVRVAGVIAIGIVAASALADHLLSRNVIGDDWARFDGRQVRFVRVIDGESIAVCEESSGEIVNVKLLGIRAFRVALDKKLADGIDSELTGKLIVLHLGPTQTRDERGRLLADALTEDGKPLSAELAGEGLALADRGSSSVFVGAVERAQSVARHKGVGMWAESEASRAQQESPRMAIRGLGGSN